MYVTVAICTWNRAPLLDQTLATLRELRLPPGVRWELLVVNNNCTDDTDAVIARHASHLPLRRLFEPKQGHSNARNCALDAARGDLILWTDDDVLVEPDWLSAYVAAAERWPEAVFFGGWIEPWYEVPPPAWLKRAVRANYFHGLLLIRDLGDVERPLTQGAEIFGANMAFRRAVFADRRFDPQLGRQGSVSLLGDETAFIDRLLQQGERGVWVPAAKVRHYVPAERMTLRYLDDYYRGVGRTRVRLDGCPAGRLLRGAPLWLHRSYWQTRFRGLWQRLLRRPLWAVTYARAACLRGMIHETRARNGTPSEQRSRSV